MAAAAQCSSLLCSCSRRPCTTRAPLSLFSPSHFLSSFTATPIRASPKQLKLSTSRTRRFVSAVVSAENTVQSSFSGTDGLELTYLEGNSWLWDVGGAKILVDPILVGNLDFGIPWLYDAAKKFLKNFRTLKPISEKYPNLRVIATPNAKALLDPPFSNVTYLEPGQSSVIEARNGSTVKVQATAGPVLGPPWQRPENGYLVITPEGKSTLYYEPHCVYNTSSLESERADIVTTPVIKQLLPYLGLRTRRCSSTCKAAECQIVLLDAYQRLCFTFCRVIVPMINGDLDAKGLLPSLVSAEGTVESFKELLSKELPDAQVLQPTPGVPLQIPLRPNLP
ncbi:unnamed protein product [Malus baccata var. baccata]